MITGSLRAQVDKIWDSFWSGGISNPITVIEQFTYLLFMRQLDDRQLEAERTAAVFGGEPDPAQVFYPDSVRHLRWHNLVQIEDPQIRFNKFLHEGFPYVKQLGSKDGSGFAAHMRDAHLQIPNASTLGVVTKLIKDLDFKNKDMGGDLYEYMLSKLSTAGTNGQFRTPSHIIELIVALADPKLGERVIDPACGTAGFLAAASEYAHPGVDATKAQRDHYYRSMFYGFDFDSTMVRIAAMNMVMHGFSSPNIAYQDSLQELSAGEQESYDVVLANPPFAGSMNIDILDPKLQGLKSKKTELLFLQRFLTLLNVGGRAAVVVPEGVLFGSTKAHKQLRQELVDRQKIDGIIKLPSGVFKPYTGVSTAIVCFTRTDSPANEHVWFYEVLADGRSLDDKRTPLLDEDLLGPWPKDVRRRAEDPTAEPSPVQLTAEQLAKNNLPDVVERFFNQGRERERARTEQSFCVPVDQIRAADYDLSMNRYKEIAFTEEETRDPLDIIADIEQLDGEIAEAMAKLKEML